MRNVIAEFDSWLRANNLEPAHFRIKVEARTIAAQRDLLAAFKADIPPSESGARPGRNPVVGGYEVVLEGPLPAFQ